MLSNIYTFSDGLRLIHQQIDSTRSVGIMVLCGVGSQNETEKENGISHFIEHNVFKGTNKRTSFQIVKDLDMLGANFNAYTSKSNTAFYTISMDSVAENCAEILADMLINPSFNEQEMENERKVILEEIAMSQDDNQDLSMDMGEEAFYGANSALGRTILGPAKNVKAFTRDDVIKYKSANYVAKDIVISIAGNISLDNAMALCEKYFVGHFARNDSRDWMDKPFITTSTYLHKFKDIEQANICINMPSPTISSPLSDATMVAMEIFGGGMSSRLFQEVREKNGLAYNVYSFSKGLVNSGLSTIYVGTNKSSAEKAVKLVKKTIQDVLDNGFDEDEIVKGKNSITTRLIIGAESTGAIMRANAQMLLNENKGFDLFEKVDKMMALKKEQIEEAFKESMQIDKASIAYVGREIDSNLLNVFTR